MHAGHTKAPAARKGLSRAYHNASSAGAFAHVGRMFGPHRACQEDTSPVLRALCDQTHNGPWLLLRVKIVCYHPIIQFWRTRKGDDKAKKYLLCSPSLSAPCMQLAPVAFP